MEIRIERCAKKGHWCDVNIQMDFPGNNQYRFLDLHISSFVGSRDHVQSTGDFVGFIIIQRKGSGWMYDIYSCTDIPFACIDTVFKKSTGPELGFPGLKVEHFEYVTWTKLHQSTVANHNVG